MATAALISVEEYLAASYRPDREFIDGQVVERNLGEYDHSRLQTILAGWFLRRERAWQVRVLVEQRVQVEPGRFRIPDVSVISRDHPVEQIVRRPPLVCAEILSPEDSMRGIQDRIDDYLAFGVPNIWVFEPTKPQAWVCTKHGLMVPEDGVLTVHDSPIVIPLQDLFADLD
jgi:Uma2 family endonuclease